MKLNPDMFVYSVLEFLCIVICQENVKRLKVQLKDCLAGIL